MAENRWPRIGRLRNGGSDPWGAGARGGRSLPAPRGLGPRSWHRPPWRASARGSPGPTESLAGGPAGRCHGANVGMPVKRGDFRCGSPHDFLTSPNSTSERPPPRHSDLAATRQARPTPAPADPGWSSRWTPIAVIRAARPPRRTPRYAYPPRHRPAGFPLRGRTAAVRSGRELRERSSRSRRGRRPLCFPPRGSGCTAGLPFRTR